MTRDTSRGTNDLRFVRASHLSPRIVAGIPIPASGLSFLGKMFVEYVLRCSDAWRVGIRGEVTVRISVFNGTDSLLVLEYSYFLRLPDL